MDIFKFNSKYNFILFLFYFLPVSFILGKAILEFNIILIIIIFLKDIISEKKNIGIFFENKIIFPLFLLWIYLGFNIHNGLDNDGNWMRALFFFKFILLIFAFAYYINLKSFRNKIINFLTIIIIIFYFDI